MELIHQSEEKRSVHSNELVQKLETDLNEKTEQNDLLTKKVRFVKLSLKINPLAKC